MAPLVSIIIPNYNYGRYIGRAIESALNQTYTNIEIIVTDNASTDDSVEIVKKYTEEYDNISLYRNEVNIGIVGNHNRGIEKSRGEYIALLSSDDYLAPEFTEKCIEQLKRYKSAGMVATAVSFADEYGKITEPANYYGGSFFVEGIYQCKIFLFSNPFGPSQVMLRRECLDDPRVGGWFSEGADTNLDTDLWFRICLYHDFVYLAERLCYYREYSGSYSKTYGDFKFFMCYYLTRLKFAGLSRGHDYLGTYADEAIRRAPYIGVRTIGILLREGRLELAKRYLKIIEALDLGIANYEYYKLVAEITDGKRQLDTPSFMRAQNEYLDSLKSEEHRGRNLSAPYDLPENAIVF